MKGVIIVAEEKRNRRDDLQRVIDEHEEMSKSIDERYLNDDDRKQLEKTDYAAELAAEKMKANNKMFAQDVLKANLPFVRTSGVNGMIDGVMEDSRIRKEQQEITDAATDIRKKALEREAKARGLGVEEMLEQDGYEKKGKDGFGYGGY